MKRKSKILVTGSNGQLGKCIRDLAESYPNYNFHFKNSKELNITKKNQIESLFLEEGYDYCINCAAYTAVDKAELEQEQAFLINSEAVKNLAKSCKVHDTILIHISTDFIFDGENNTSYLENDITNPINIYGSSKLKGENYIKEILSEYYILRTSWVYSQYGSNFVKTMLKLGDKLDSISVVNNQFGSPTCAPDLAKLILLICNSSKKLYGVYNFSNEGEISWYDFAKEIFRLNNCITELIGIPASDYITPAIRPKYSVLNKSKIKSNFGIKINNWKASLEKHFLNEN